MNKLRRSLCFIVAFSFITKSYATEEESQRVEFKQKSDIKTGDELVITEDPADGKKETTNIPEKINKKSEDNKDVGSQEVISVKVNSKNAGDRIYPKEDQKDSNYGKNKETDNKNSQKHNEGPIRDGGNKKSDIKKETKKKSTENKYTEKLDKPKNRREEEADIKYKENKINRKNKPIKTSIPKPNINKTSSDGISYKESVDLANNIISSKKLNKEESKKIETDTKDIVKEYNKKIEAAKTSQEKKELAKEASEKINKTLEQTSKLAYDDAKKEVEPSILDQKNETLVIEIDGEDEVGSKKDNSEEDYNTNPKGLSKDPKVYKEENHSYKAKEIAMVILLIVGLSLAFIYTLKRREDS